MISPGYDLKCRGPSVNQSVFCLVARGEHLAIHEMEEGKHLVVVYREGIEDGFIITAFVTRRVRSLEKRRQVWP